MPSIGPAELIILLLIVLLLFGAKRLPELGRSIGQSVREFKGTLSAVRDDEPVQLQPPPAGTPNNSAD